MICELKKAAQMREYYERCKAEHKCFRCGGAVEDGKTRCGTCREKHNALYRRQREELKRLHKCTNCGAELPQDGTRRTRCDVCRAIWRIYTKESQERRKRREAVQD